MNQPAPSPAPSASLRESECGNCGSHRRWVLHHVRIRGVHRRLCTSCVLRLHPSSFCPSCFQFYDSASVPPLSKRLTCSKCSSFTHSHCAAAAAAGPASASAAAAAGPASASASAPSPANWAPGGYLCSSCSAPAGTALFDLDAGSGRAIDRRMALVLLCAAKISASSMSKAVVVARAEAERRVREAALARKRAREAIENLAVVVGGGVEGPAAEASAPARSVLNPRPAVNGFPPPSAAARRGENGDAGAANGNAGEKDQSGSVEVKMERMEIEQAPLK